MRYLSTLFATLLLFSATSTFAYTLSSESDSTNSETKSSKKEKKSKDAQNQTQYLQPDEIQQPYNLNDRTSISKPQMPHYDLPPDSAGFGYTKKKKAQQEAFLSKKYYFPAKPKNQWELGIGLGSFILSGDVAPNPNPLKSYGATFTVRKAFGYIFSLRLQYMYGNATGQDWKPKDNSIRNPVLNGSLYPGVIDYVHNSPSGSRIIFPNYKMQVHEVSLQGVATLGNVKFHRERNIVNFYLYAGGGAILYRTKTNVLDENNQMYDYSSVLNTYNNTANSSGTFLSNKRKSETLKALKDLNDKTFETEALSNRTSSGGQGDRGQLLDKYTISPTFSFGFGIGFHASKRLTINLETRVNANSDDLFDGQKFQEDVTPAGGSTTTEVDVSLFNAVTFNFHLGKKSLEPMWWLNPMHYTYQKLAEMDPNKIIDDLLKDDDGDGVPNRLDKEANTKKDCPVDPKGIALDSDKDGVIDCEDKEPFSPPGFPIDATGIAKVPCCAEGMTFKGSGNGSSIDCSKAELPEIHFADDKYGVGPEYYAHLHEVADRLQMCPDAKIVVNGIATDGKYGEQLSWNRVNKAIDYITSKYGISRDRFIVKFTQAPKTTNPSEKANLRRVEFRIAQEGESGPSNPPAPHPGLKAGTER